MVGHFEFNRFFRVHPTMKSDILFCSNGPAISFLDIRRIEVKGNGPGKNHKKIGGIILAS